MNYIPKKITFGDLFAGGGGVTTGALSIPGVSVLWALNHDEIAIQTHARNHPETRHYQADIRQQDEKELDRVDILWASLECTNFTAAKGGKPKDADSRTLADEMPRYVRHCDPAVIMIENVREFLTWGPLNEKGKPIEERKGEDFHRWINEIKSLGYPNAEWRIMDAADYGAYTSRKRLFIIFAKKDIDIRWKSITHHANENNLQGLPKWKAVRECIDLDHHGESIFTRKKPIVPNTLKRIEYGINKFFPEFFLIKYYGSGNNVASIDKPCATITTKDRHALISFEKKQFITEYYGRKDACQSIDNPCHTITTSNRHALVTIDKKQFITDHCWSDSAQSLDDPLRTQLTWQTKQLITIKLFQDSGYDIFMRFLNPRELAIISGFPADYFAHKELKLSWKSQVKMIGNAVPTGLAAATIEPMIPEVEKIKVWMVA